MPASLKREEFLAHITETMSPPEMRALAASLLQISDSIDQNWSDTNVKSVYLWPSELSRIERNSLDLAFKAKIIYLQRQKRHDYFPAHLMNEPAWDILLDLFMQFAGGAKVSISSLCIASNAPASTALRYITALENEGFVIRTHSETDGRVSFVSLSDRGILAMGRYLTQY